MKTIVYYDLASEYYLAYPLDGLLREAGNHGFRIRISKRVPKLLRDIEWSGTDVRRLFSLGVFKVLDGSKPPRWFCIDTHDDSSPDGYFRPLLGRVDWYFKLNFNQDLIAENPWFQQHLDQIYPLGCTFAIRPSQAWRFLPRPFPAYGLPWGGFEMKRRLVALARNPSMEGYRRMRAIQQESDVFVARRYYTEPEHMQSNLDYLRVFEGLAEIGGVSGIFGFTGLPETAPDFFQRFNIGSDRTLREHLTLTAISRICVYLPGTYNCLSFKFGQFLAMGKPVVGLALPFSPISGIMDADREVLEAQFVCASVDEIAPRLDALRKDPERIADLRSRNVEIFERYFSPVAVARRIMEICK
jgi:hypothetical protein